ncbi:hypothetical protein BS47DRAFT_1402388 [Hydnum rufescens UP504]|uniref:Uncharacterized protein n=1 Tax=Hydnum rufescens UP504 TaxID=1448309 RepID=A0A9P6AEJ0_9AGAM|nr:hypothetical protein BS47DRAFT_1402388 [Hydnum rufescens UP504]
MPPKWKCRKVTAEKAVDLNDLNTFIGQYSKSENTNIRYAGILHKADEWLPNHLSQMNPDKDDFSVNIPGFEHTSPRNIFSNKTAKFAFREPMECTPHLLGMYLYNDCIIQGNGKSTADQIRAAFLLWFEQLDGDRFSRKTQWSWDLSQGPGKEGQGNPIQCYLVDEVYKSIVHAATMRGDSRTHSKAITVGDLTRIYNWSSNQCDATALLKKPVLSADEISGLTLHLFWLAFSSTAFTIWTRNMELSNLHHSDLDWDHVVAHHCIQHVQISLRKHKDEQQRAARGESRIEELCGM